MVGTCGERGACAGGCGDDTCGCGGAICGCGGAICGCGDAICGCGGAICGCGDAICGCGDAICGCGGDICDCGGDFCGCGGDTCGSAACGRGGGASAITAGSDGGASAGGIPMIVCAGPGTRDGRAVGCGFAATATCGASIPITVLASAAARSGCARCRGPGDLGQQLPQRQMTPPAALLERLADDAIDVAAQPRSQRRRRLRHRRQVLLHQAGSVAGKGRLAREREVVDRAEAVDVRALIDRLALGLLGRQESRGRRTLDR